MQTVQFFVCPVCVCVCGGGGGGGPGGHRTPTAQLYTNVALFGFFRILFRLGGLRSMKLKIAIRGGGGGGVEGRGVSKEVEIETLGEALLLLNY